MLSVCKRRVLTGQQQLLASSWVHLRRAPCKDVAPVAVSICQAQIEHSDPVHLQ